MNKSHVMKRPHSKFGTSSNTRLPKVRKEEILKFKIKLKQ